MGDPKVHGADELEALSPNERDELVRDGIITEPDAMPTDLVDRARARLASRVAARDASTPAR